MTIEMLRRGAAVLMIGLFMGALGACDQDGPAEQAGEAIDDTAEEATDAVKDATN
jgi:hypothetical protein